MRERQRQALPATKGEERPPTVSFEKEGGGGGTRHALMSLWSVCGEEGGHGML